MLLTERNHFCAVNLVTSMSELMGKKVVGANAYMLGEINGAEMDTKQWIITHLHVTLTGEATRELGFQKPRLGSLTVFLPVSIVQAVGDIITLNKSIRELREIIEPKK